MSVCQNRVAVAGLAGEGEPSAVVWVLVAGAGAALLLAAKIVLLHCCHRTK